MDNSKRRASGSRRVGVGLVCNTGTPLPRPCLYTFCHRCTHLPYAHHLALHLSPPFHSHLYALCLRCASTWLTTNAVKWDNS